MQDFLANQVCLVTGGAQGIGWAITQALADHGADVYACTFSIASLDRASQELACLPWADHIHLAQCDVTDRAQVESWISALYQQTGRIDVLVNNANVITWSSVVKSSIENAEHVMRVGYDGMVYSIKAVLPLMLAASQGHIINIGSSAGRVFLGGVPASYAAAKAAINAYTQVLQAELEGSPVRVTLLRPGTVAGTDFFRKHNASSRLPRLTDLVPPLTPPQVALSVVQAIRCKHTLVDIPRYLSMFYLLFDLAPQLFRWLTAVGSGAQKDYGQVEWRYTPHK